MLSIDQGNHHLELIQSLCQTLFSPREYAELNNLLTDDIDDIRNSEPTLDEVDQINLSMSISSQ